MSAIYVANRVKEACTGSGLNNLVLTGPMTGFRAFADAIPVGVPVLYLLQDGTDWEIGIGTLSSESELARTTILDSSTTTGEVNNQDPGTPVKLSLSDSQHTVGAIHDASRSIILDEDLLIANPSPFRQVVFKDTLALMKAEEGVIEGETIVCLGGAALADGDGGIFRYDADDATAPDNVNTFRNDNETIGLHKRIYGKVQILDTATDLGGVSPSDAKVSSQLAVKTYIDALLGAQDAMIFKGVIDCSANPNYPAASRGHTYRVSVAGKIGGASGTTVEVGDLLICLTDSTSSGNQATVGSSWTITQTNNDGAVIGPASVTNESFATFDGTTGKLIKELQKSLVPQRLASMTALRSATWTAALAPVAVQLDYGWAVGDMGGGLFILDSSDTTTADNHGTIILTSTSGTALRYKRVYGGAAAAIWFNAVGDGTTDDTTPLTRALAAAKIVRLTNGLDYLISSGLTPQTGGGFVCDEGRKAWLKAKTGSGGFNVLSVGGTRTDADRCMFRGTSGLDDLVLYNIGFKTDDVTEVVIYPVRTSAAGQTKGIDFRKLAFKDFFLGELVGLNSLTGENRYVQIDYARNCGGSQAASYWSGTPLSCSVVVIDNDIVSSTPSQPIRVDIGDIKDILHSGTLLSDASGNQETDGVTVVCHGANTSAGHIINIGSIDGIGEAVDLQGHRTVVNIGRINRASNDGIKIIHGGSHNVVTVGEIEASGRSAVSIWGSDSADATTDTSDNVVRIGRVVLPGTFGLGITSSNICAAMFGNMTLTRKPKRNQILIDSVVGDSTNLDYIVYCGDANQSLGDDANRVEIGWAKGWVTATCSAAPGNVRVTYKAPCRTKLALASSQTFVTATSTKVAWAETLVDDEGLADLSNNKLIIKWPGYYSVRARLRADSWENATPDQFIFELRQNNSAIDFSKDHIHFGSKDMVIELNSFFYVDENDLGGGNAEILTHFTHDVGSDRTVSDNNFMTYIEVVRLK